MKISSLEQYLVSSMVTFISAFAIAVLANWTNQSWSHDVLFALGGAGIRAGVKAILEMLAVIKPTVSVSSGSTGTTAV